MPQSYAEHRGGEGEDIPSTAFLRSSSERECCFSDGTCLACNSVCVPFCNL